MAFLKNVRQRVVAARRSLGFLKNIQRTHLAHVEKMELQINALKKELKKHTKSSQSSGAKRVVFVCHNPSLWGKVRSIHTKLINNPAFDVVVVAVPYKHGAFKKAEYRDGGVYDFLDKNEIEYIPGFNEKNESWLDLQDLNPRYVFFQTPYTLFPDIYSAEHVSIFAEVCYVPYVGILLYQGTVERSALPLSFFEHVSYAFMPNQEEADHLYKKFNGAVSKDIIQVCGAPMLDYTIEGPACDEGAWKLDKEDFRKRILWTPRWHTAEGNCHFFDYTDKLLDLAQGGDNIELLFRPHSLCFSNFEKTGEYTAEQQVDIRQRFGDTANASIDESGEYENTFLCSDILISDMSSMLGEFLVTGKPIIYTHRVNSFNELGSKLSEGFYWVENYVELKETLDMLLRGEDPLMSKRLELVERYFHIPENGAAFEIETILNS